MDIRNFFAKKKKSAEASLPNSKDGDAASSAKNESSSDQGRGAPKSTSAVAAAAAGKKTIITSSSEKKRKEVSPADFFDDSSSSIKPPPTKRPSHPPRSSREKRSGKGTTTQTIPLKDDEPDISNDTTKATDVATKESDPSDGQLNLFAKKRRSDDDLPEKATNVNSKASSSKENGNKTKNNPDASKPKAAPESPPPPQQEEVLKGPELKKKRVSQGASKSPPKIKPKTFSVSEITEQTTFTTQSATPMCLEGLTFCFSGVMDDLDRQEASDMIKTLGGRVTANVSSKTNYLVLGSILEDGRPVEQGSKYRRAESEAKVVVLHGTGQLYGLLQKYSGPGPGAGIASSMAAASAPSASAPLVAPAKTSVGNPYAQKPSNPYASKGNPYAKKPPEPSAPDTKPNAILKTTGVNDLWVDKYKPLSSGEILGNTESVKKLTTWLRTWEDRFNNPQASKKTFSSPSGPWKAALLSGPPGIGKTTTATVVARENGRDVLEFNASDVRSKKALQEQVGDITGSSTLQFSTAKAKTKRCIIMDEVDGMGAGDRSGVSELIQMIKKTKVPIICICNDRQSQKLKSLIPYCMDLRYRRPVKSVIAHRAIEVAAREGMKVEQNAVEAIAESCGNDIRQVLNCLQMWSSKVGESLSYKTLMDREYSIKKDEILRVSLFEATKVIVEGRRGLGANSDAATERSHLFHRNDAYFVDYNFIGLMVHQNYLKVMQPQYNDIKSKNDADGMLAMLERVHGAAEAMSDWALCEERVRTTQSWSLLPVSAAMVLRTGSLAGGRLGGGLPSYPEFTSYLGRISTRSKKIRLLGELGFHLNYKIQGGRDELRMAYLPTFRSQFMMYLKNGNIDQAIALMDEYGLDRNDILERFDEFQFDGSLFDNLDSKTKAALTRSYNQGAHKSQALVAEQGAGPKKRKVGSSSAAGEPVDPDAINEDAVDDDEEEEEIDDEADADKIRSMFQAKGKKGGGKKPAASKEKKPAAAKEKKPAAAKAKPKPRKKKT